MSVDGRNLGLLRAFKLINFLISSKSFRVRAQIDQPLPTIVFSGYTLVAWDGR